METNSQYNGQSWMKIVRVAIKGQRPWLTFPLLGQVVPAGNSRRNSSFRSITILFQPWYGDRHYISHPVVLGEPCETMLISSEPSAILGIFDHDILLGHQLGCILAGLFCNSSVAVSMIDSRTWYQEITVHLGISALWSCMVHSDSNDVQYLLETTT